MGDHVFICYARKNQEFVLPLVENLKKLGVSTWIDQQNIPLGANWDITIDNAISDCKFFLIVLSKSSVDSPEVRGELRTALDEGKNIIPLVIEECRLPRQLRLIQYIDFKGCQPNHDGKLKQILKVLSSEASLQKAFPGTGESDKENSNQKDLVKATEEYINDDVLSCGLALGKTTEQELILMGGNLVEKLDFGNGEYEANYALGELVVTVENGLVHDIYLDSMAPLPDEWIEIGFDWNYSIKEWLGAFEAIGYSVDITNPLTFSRKEDMVLILSKKSKETLEITFHFNEIIDAETKDEIADLRGVLNFIMIQLKD